MGEISLYSEDESFDQRICELDAVFFACRLSLVNYHWSEKYNFLLHSTSINSLLLTKQARDLMIAAFPDGNSLCMTLC
jgi:hypothetical protein